MYFLGIQECQNVDCSIPGEPQRCPQDCKNGKFIGYLKKGNIVEFV